MDTPKWEAALKRAGREPAPLALAVGFVSYFGGLNGRPWKKLSVIRTMFVPAGATGRGSPRAGDGKYWRKNLPDGGDDRGSNPWTAADARVGIGRAGPGGPARTEASAPHGWPN